MRRQLTALCALLFVIAAPVSARANIELWPLLERTDDSTVVLYPLYVHEGDFLMMAPFYYRTHQRRDHHVVWPLVKLSEGQLGRVAPFWFQRRTPERVDRVLAPVFVYHHNLVRDNRWLFVGPWFQTSSPVARSRFLIPVYADVANSLQDSHTTLIGPYFRRAHGDRRSHWLFPIFGVTRGGDTSMLWVATVIRTRAPEVERDWYFPLYMSTRRAPASAAAGETSRWFTLLWPLYEREEVRAADGQLLERHRRFLLFSDSYEHGRRTFRLFGIPIIERL
jgi:hypothetical protein